MAYRGNYEVNVLLKVVTLILCCSQVWAKKALIIGVTVKMVAYLAELLLDKGYEVHVLNDVHRY